MVIFLPPTLCALVRTQAMRASNCCAQVFCLISIIFSSMHRPYSTACERMVRDVQPCSRATNGTDRVSTMSRQPPDLGAAGDEGLGELRDAHARAGACRRRSTVHRRESAMRPNRAPHGDTATQKIRASGSISTAAPSPRRAWPSPHRARGGAPPAACCQCPTWRTRTWWRPQQSAHPCAAVRLDGGARRSVCAVSDARPSALRTRHPHSDPGRCAPANGNVDRSADPGELVGAVHRAGRG